MVQFNNTYSQLPKRFFAKAKAAKVPNPKILEFNWDLSNELGLKLESLATEELSEIFTGQKLLAGSCPIAQAYSGHQFGHFSASLGDGRALLMGEILSPAGLHYDVQLKGSGPTPFSRNGDGKSSLGPVIREYIVSEAMRYLRVPTTRALCAISTGELVYREQALPGGVFTRIASSHIRIGTFEYFASRGDNEAVKILADYSIDRHYPKQISSENIYLDFLMQVAESQSTLVAKWMSYGFIHGVMNTDNMAISGETLDYGPCAFMDNFSASRRYSFIDKNGRYAYNNQIPIAKWNLYRLAECLVSLIDDDSEKAIGKIEKYFMTLDELYHNKWLTEMCSKLGLENNHNESEELINEWLELLEEENLDFTLSFRNLSQSDHGFESTPRFEKFYSNWKNKLDNQTQTKAESFTIMNQVNPLYIARNHQVEKAITLAISGDYSKFKEMNQVLRSPFKEQPEFKEYQKPPLENERIAATFCGT